MNTYIFKNPSYDARSSEKTIEVVAQSLEIAIKRTKAIFGQEAEFIAMSNKVDVVVYGQERYMPKHSFNKLPNGIRRIKSGSGFRYSQT